MSLLFSPRMLIILSTGALVAAAILYALGFRKKDLAAAVLISLLVEAGYVALMPLFFTDIFGFFVSNIKQPLLADISLSALILSVLALVKSLILTMVAGTELKRSLLGFLAVGVVLYFGATVIAPRFI